MNYQVISDSTLAKLAKITTDATVLEAINAEIANRATTSAANPTTVAIPVSDVTKPAIYSGVGLIKRVTPDGDSGFCHVELLAVIAGKDGMIKTNLFLQSLSAKQMAEVKEGSFFETSFEEHISGVTQYADSKTGIVLYHGSKNNTPKGTISWGVSGLIKSISDETFTRLQRLMSM